VQLVVAYLIVYFWITLLYLGFVLSFSFFSSSDELSWRKSRDLLEKVARQGDLTGYRVPCLLIAAKDDLTPYPRAVQDSVKVLHINSVL